jgi:hypothetical protein
MVAARVENEDLQTILSMSLEQALQINLQALEYIRVGQEGIAQSVLKDALIVLTAISGHVDGDIAVPVNDDLVVGPFSYGLAPIQLPPMDDLAPGVQVPRWAISIIDDGTFSQHHGAATAHAILSALTVYNVALSAHRECCRPREAGAIHLARSSELYEACVSAFVFVEELQSVKFVLDASIGEFYSLFDFPAAA